MTIALIYECIVFSFVGVSFVQSQHFMILDDVEICGSTVLDEFDVVSRRHCAYLCADNTSCEAANYELSTSHCQLRESPATTLKPKTGSQVLFKMDRETGEKFSWILSNYSYLSNSLFIWI